MCFTLELHSKVLRHVIHDGQRERRPYFLIYNSINTSSYKYCWQKSEIRRETWRFIQPSHTYWQGRVKERTGIVLFFFFFLPFILYFPDSNEILSSDFSEESNLKHISSSFHWKSSFGWVKRTFNPWIMPTNDDRMTCWQG